MNIAKKIISGILSALMLVSSMGIAPVFALGEEDVTIYGLQTDYRTNPIGIDNDAPVFSWKMNASERGQKQTAYQVFVSDSKENLDKGVYVWNSGKKTNDNSNGVVYLGEELEPSTRYYWKVKVWDKDGAAFISKEEAYFETGLMGSGWSNASWIGKNNGSSNDDEEDISFTDTVFTIDLDFKVKTTAFGIIFGASDTSNFYMWQISTLVKKVRPHVWTDGSASLIGESSVPSTAGLSANTQAHLKIDVNNGNINTYINDVLCSTISVSKFELGKIGFRASGERFYADNVVVKNASGEVIFEDDFSNVSNPNFSDGVIQDGQLYVDGYQVEKRFLQCSAKSFENSTFAIDVDFQIENGAFGLVFGATNENNYYMWQLNASYEVDNVTLRPHQWVNGIAGNVGAQPVLTDIFPTKDDAIGVTTHMRVEVDKGNIKTYINDILVDERVVAEFEMGSVGLRAQNEKFLADNLVVRDAEGNIVNNYTFDEGGVKEFSGGTLVDGWLEVSSGPIFPIESAMVEASPMLRKEFSVSQTKAVKSARLYATAAGIYEFYINGSRVSDSYFNPGSTQYNKTVMYQTFDVTDMIKGGENAIGSILGKGWFNGATRGFGSTLALMAKLLITYEDGTTESVVTDKTWSYTGSGPVISNDYFMGEEYDATREQDGWDSANFDASKWLSAGVYDKNSLGIGEIIAQETELIRNVITLTPVAVTSPKKGVYIYDFGQNFAGIPRITATAAKGTTMRIRYGEMLNLADMKGGDGAEGTLYTENLHAALNIDYYTFKGDPDGETFEPSLVYHGFRYMEITGLDEALPLEDVKGLVLYTSLEETGSFECSNELVNQLYSNTLWSQRSNFMSIPTDCPQRNERWGWTGDAQVFALTASYNMNTDSFFRKYTKDMRDTQASDGRYTDVSPGHVPTGWTFTNGNATSGWGDAGVIIPWQMYMQYGDTDIIVDNYSAMCAWVEHLVSDSNNFIRDKGWTGDWLSIDETTPFGVTDTAFCAYSATLLSKMAAIIGKTTDSEKYAGYANSFKKAWNREFVNADGSTKCNTQTSYVLGLKFNLFDDSLRANAAANLVENIVNNDYHLTTGFLGVSYLNPVLTEMGYEDIAYKLLEQTTSPSWLYAVTTGATTIWESWDALKIYDDGTSEVNSTSFNHYSYGAICEWLYTDVAGIARDEESPAFKNIILKPELGGSLTYAKASYDSLYGTITSDWTLDENKLFTYKVSIPTNTTATVYLPTPLNGSAVTESGKAIAEAEGVTYVGTDDEGRLIYNLESGSYTFALSTDPTLDDLESVPEGYIQPSINSDLFITRAKINEWWGNNGNPFLALTLSKSGGINFKWNLNDSYTLRNGLIESFSLSNLYLGFDNFTNTSTSGGNFAIILTDDLADEHAIDCQQAVSALSSIVLEVDTTDGVLRFANSGHNGNFMGYTNKGTTLIQSDLLKYANINGKPFSIAFSEGTDGAYNITLTVDGEVVTANNALTAEMLATVTNLKNTDCLFVVLSDFGKSLGVSVDYKLVGPERVTETSEGLIVPVEGNMGVYNFWKGGMLSRSELPNGGMRFRFINAIINVRQAIDVKVKLDGLKLEFDNFNPFNTNGMQNSFALMFANTNVSSGIEFGAYDGMLAIMINAEDGKIVQFNGSDEAAIYTNSNTLVADTRIRNLAGKPFSVTFRKTEDGTYRIIVKSEDYSFAADLDPSYASAFNMDGDAYVTLTAANSYYNRNFELDWLGIGNLEFITGDANDDKSVDIKDLVHMKKNLAGKNETVNSFDNADCNLDGVLDSADLVQLRKKLLEK